MTSKTWPLSGEKQCWLRACWASLTDINSNSRHPDHAHPTVYIDMQIQYDVVGHWVLAIMHRVSSEPQTFVIPTHKLTVHWYHATKKQALGLFHWIDNCKLFSECMSVHDLICMGMRYYLLWWLCSRGSYRQSVGSRANLITMYVAYIYANDNQNALHH